MAEDSAATRTASCFDCRAAGAPGEPEVDSGETGDASRDVVLLERLKHAFAKIGGADKFNEAHWSIERGSRKHPAYSYASESTRYSNSSAKAAAAFVVGLDRLLESLREELVAELAGLYRPQQWRAILKDPANRASAVVEFRATPSPDTQPVVFSKAKSAAQWYKAAVKSAEALREDIAETREALQGTESLLMARMQASVRDLVSAARVRHPTCVPADADSDDVEEEEEEDEEADEALAGQKKELKALDDVSAGSTETDEASDSDSESEGVMITGERAADHDEREPGGAEGSEGSEDPDADLPLAQRAHGANARAAEEAEAAQDGVSLAELASLRAPLKGVDEARVERLMATVREVANDIGMPDVDPGNDNRAAFLLPCQDDSSSQAVRRDALRKQMWLVVAMRACFDGILADLGSSSRELADLDDAQLMMLGKQQEADVVWRQQQLDTAAGEVRKGLQVVYDTLIPALDAHVGAMYSRQALLGAQLQAGEDAGPLEDCAPMRDLGEESERSEDDSEDAAEADGQGNLLQFVEPGGAPRSIAAIAVKAWDTAMREFECGVGEAPDLEFQRALHEAGGDPTLAALVAPGGKNKRKYEALLERVDGTKWHRTLKRRIASASVLCFADAMRRAAAALSACSRSSSTAAQSMTDLTD
jgi:hypothetical protein